MKLFTNFALFIVNLFCFESLTAYENNNGSTRILYIRHGEVPGNDASLPTYTYTGSGTDDSLTEKGRAQALACSERISSLLQTHAVDKITAIYASNLKRAQETAEPIAEVLSLPIHLNSELREINWGIADGALVDDMMREFGEEERQVKNYYTDRKIRWDHLPVFEGSETYNALLLRTTNAISSIAKEHSGEVIIIVGHGRVLKTLIADSLDTEQNIPYPKNCGIAEFIYSQDGGLKFIRVVDE